LNIDYCNDIISTITSDRAIILDVLYG